MVAELAAHLRDVNVDRAGLAVEVVAPDALQQLFPRHHNAFVLGQSPEQVELLGAKRDRLAVDGGLAPLPVDSERSRTHDAVRRSALALGAPQDRPNAGGEFARVERLAHIVVRTQLQPDDAVDIVRAGREHENRHLRLLAEGAAHFQAVHLRHHHV